MNFLKTGIIFIVLQAVLIDIATSTISKKSKKKKSKKDKDLPRLNVRERDLISTKLVAGEILDNEKKYCKNEQNSRNWDHGEVLAYVTPWNNHGYDVAKTFAKFTMISPVWLQIKRKSRGFYNMEGLHDVDRTWMKAVKEVNPKVKIVPRILFDGWKSSDYDSLFASEDEIESMIEKMIATLIEFKMQGAVIEVWTQVANDKHDDLIHVLKHIGEEFHKKNLICILAIPPGINSAKQLVGFSSSHLEKLADSIDFFSLMSYDFFVQSGEAGPNAPIDWVKACILVIDPDSKYRKQILTGLNFYGMMYTKNGKIPVIGEQYKTLLAKFNPEITWESVVQEHFVDVKDEAMGRTMVFYPTLKSINVRLEMIKEMGAGVSIWEIGQGLDYFYDLL